MLIAKFLAPREWQLEFEMPSIRNELSGPKASLNATGLQIASGRGMLAGFMLANYPLLVEHEGRMFCEGKASITAEVTDILARVGS